MLYRVGQVVIYGGGLDPRISYRIFKVSDKVAVGRLEEWSAVRSLRVPTSTDPRDWLEEALEQLL